MSRIAIGPNRRGRARVRPPFGSSGASDDFNRPGGGLGGNWNNSSGWAVVSDTFARKTGNSAVATANTSTVANGRVFTQAKVAEAWTTNGTTSPTGGVTVRSNSGGTEYIVGGWRRVASAWELAILASDGTVLANVSHTGPSTNDVLRLEGVDGHLRLYVNGVLKLTAASTLYDDATHVYGGMYGSTDGTSTVAFDDWSAGTVNADSSTAPNLAGLVSWYRAYYIDSSEMQAAYTVDGAVIPTWFDALSNFDMIGAAAPQEPTLIAVDSNFNNRRTIDSKGGSSGYTFGASAVSEPGLAQPFSVVVVGKYSNAAGGRHTLFDGTGTGNRALLRVNNGGTAWDIFNGTTIRTLSGAADNNPHLFAVYFNNAGTTRAEIDGITRYSGAGGGAHAFDGLALGNNAGAGTSAASFLGQYVFAGVFNGDVATDPGWPAFKAAVANYYKMGMVTA